MKKNPQKKQLANTMEACQVGHIFQYL